jgi:tRNA-modifying protein YgfZ
MMIMNAMTAPVLPDPRAWWGALAWAPANAPLQSPLSHLGLIAAQGPDAATFLHGQLSQDIKNLAENEARLAAYCSAKGRMLASFVVLHPAPDTYWLLVNKEVLPAVLKRLSMFVMRSKLKLTDATADLHICGAMRLAAAGGEVASADQAMAVTVTPAATAATADGWPSVVCEMPPVQGVSRSLVIGPVSEPLTAHAPAQTAWRWLEVMAAVPQIEPATVEQFVPQMVNYELIGGVNFKKGCYPGQEVVARSQYRGTTKRRAFVLLTDADASPGAELFSSVEPGQPAGMVINAAPLPSSGSGQAVLAELKLTAVDALAQGASLHLGSVDGAALVMGPQPYDIPRAEEAA